MEKNAERLKCSVSTLKKKYVNRKGSIICVEENKFKFFNDSASH